MVTQAFNPITWKTEQADLCREIEEKKKNQDPELSNRACDTGDSQNNSNLQFFYVKAQKLFTFVSLIQSF